MNSLSLGLCLDRAPRRGGGVSPPPPPSLATGLWGFWPLDGDAQDASGNGNHLTKGGTAPVWVGGLNGLAFASSDGVPLSVRSLGIPTSGGLTISAWFLAGPSRPDDEVLYESAVQVVALDGVYGFSRAPRGANPLNPDLTPVRIQLLDDYTYYDPPPHADAGEWTHAVIVYHPTDGVTVYYNGGNAQNVAGDVPLQECTEFALDAAFGPICNAGVWTRALSADEVASLYTTVDPTRVVRKLTDGLLALYEFDGNGNDSSGNGLTLGILGTEGPNYRVGILGTAFSYGNMARLSGLEAPMTWSVSFWVQTDVGQSDTGLSALTNNGLNNLFTVTADGVERYIGVLDGFLGEQLADAGWTHVALTHNAGYVELYINGGLTQTYDGDAFPFNGIELYNLNDFSTPLDGLTIHSRALSASEVAGMYRHGLAAKGQTQPYASNKVTMVELEERPIQGYTATVDLDQYENLPPFIALRVQYEQEGNYVCELRLRNANLLPGQPGNNPQTEFWSQNTSESPDEVDATVWLETAKLKEKRYLWFEIEEPETIPSPTSISIFVSLQW